MPRKSRVLLDEAVEVLKEFILAGNFKDNNFPVKSSEIWIQMSQRFGGQWTANDVYREVREDRRKILSKAREAVVGPIVNRSLSTSNEDFDAFEAVGEINLDPGCSEWEASGTETISLPISEELFNAFHEKEPFEYKRRSSNVLECFKWGSMLAERLYEYTYIPCSFEFKNAKIYSDAGSTHYLTIQGKCQSDLCGNKIFVFLDKKPSNFPCQLYIRTKDTFGQPHDIHRPVQKFQRLNNKPRNARVSIDDAVEMLKEFISLGNFKDNNFPVKSSEIWIQMSERLDGKWAASDVYREVREDRRKILSKAREAVGVPIVTRSFSSTRKEDIDISEAESEIKLDPNDSEWEAPGTETILLPISEKFFEALHEKEPVKYKNKSYYVLKRYKWTTMLAERIHAYTKLPCSFVFKSGRISSDAGSAHYLTIQGKCKSDLCGNKILAFLDQKPSNFPCALRIRTRDTFGQPHEIVRRPVRKFQRLTCAKALNKDVGNETKRQKQKIVQCKKFLHEKLQIISDGHDIVDTIENMRYSTLYSGFIHDVKRDNFYVIYSSLNQLITYKSYCKLTNKNSKISIGGTESIVKPIVHYNGRESGPIFFYAIFINYNGKFYSVHQLLTENKSSQLLLWWLKNWLYVGAPKPKEVSCDSSWALINALSFAFNDQSIKFYIDTIFLQAIKDSSRSARPPISTFIHLDVGNFICKISRQKSLKNKKNSLVRSFYMHCIALLMACQSVEQFETIFRLICIVALNKQEDSIIKVTQKDSEDARLQLHSLIAAQDFTEIDRIIRLDETADIGTEKYNVEKSDDHYDDGVTELSPVRIFVNNIYKSAQDVSMLGSISNAYYFKDFIDEFLDKAYEFPLWTLSCLPDKGPHARASSIEHLFCDKKKRSLKNWNNLVPADVFLKAEYQDYESSSADLQSNVIITKKRCDLDNKFECDKILSDEKYLSTGHCDKDKRKKTFNGDINDKSKSNDSNNSNKKLNSADDYENKQDMEINDEDLNVKIKCFEDNYSNKKSNTAANYKNHKKTKLYYEELIGKLKFYNKNDFNKEHNSAATDEKNEKPKVLDENIYIICVEDEVESHLPEDDL